MPKTNNNLNSEARLSNNAKLKRLRTLDQVNRELELLGYWFQEGGAKAHGTNNARNWQSKLIKRRLELAPMNRTAHLRKAAAQRVIAKAFHKARNLPTTTRGTFVGRGFRNFMNQVRKEMDPDAKPRTPSPRRSPRPSSPKSPAAAWTRNSNTANIAASIERKWSRLKAAYKEGRMETVRRLAREIRAAQGFLYYGPNANRWKPLIRKVTMGIQKALWPNVA